MGQASGHSWSVAVCPWTTTQHGVVGLTAVPPWGSQERGKIRPNVAKLASPEHAVRGAPELMLRYYVRLLLCCLANHAGTARR